MGGRWNHSGFHLQSLVFIFFMMCLQISKIWSLNFEGHVLLEFPAKVVSDPYGAFGNWNPNDRNPCTWSGVHCVGTRVQILDLKELSLGGILTPELGKLSHLKALVLRKNHFSGVIPKEIGGLTMLELLDIRGNNLSGTIPAELGKMMSLKSLLLRGNKFQGSIPPELGKMNMLSELQVDQNLMSAMETATGCINRKFGNCFKFRKGSLLGHREKCSDNPPSSYIVQNVQHVINSIRRRLLQEPINLPADPVSSAPPAPDTTVLSTGSGSFLAVQNATNINGKNKQSTAPESSPPIPNPPFQNFPENRQGSGRKWKYVLLLPGVAFLLTVAAAVLLMCRSRGGATIGPWKTGLSGQLQKAFVTGVPKLNRSELEASCEDFSNIIDTLLDCTVYKGTLSSGVEIAVASTAVASAKEWSKCLEMHFRKKIATLSRVNHKNFVNLLGYCEEDDHFTRMMVFEYAPNGSLFEHLHVKEVEHLNWDARMRIVMGMAYCLQYMHHDLNPPVAHPNLQSSAVFLTDDYAAKIADISFWKEAAAKGKISGDDHSEYSNVDPESNVYSFGILLLEIISGKLPYSKEQGSLVNWATDCLSDKHSISYMIDPTLKSFKKNELDIICEAIQDCICQDSSQRPTMKEITAKLREVIDISSDAATPKLSPLWWAELEILSVEAT